MADDSYDAIISGQLLEHNEFFWLTFLEMARVLKMGGIMVHIAPSRGPEHRAPQDCWRLYRDGMTAMAKWAGLECVETTTDWAPQHFEIYERVPRYRQRISSLRNTMVTEDTDWADTLVFSLKRVLLIIRLAWITFVNSLVQLPREPARIVAGAEMCAVLQSYPKTAEDVVQIVLRLPSLSRKLFMHRGQRFEVSRRHGARARASLASNQARTWVQTVRRQKMADRQAALSRIAQTIVC